MMSLPQIQKISLDEMRKIYPQKYYKKYARHDKISVYQQETLNKQTNDNYEILRKRRSQQMPKLPDVPQKKQYNPRFQTYKSIIDINKFEVQRIGKYTKALSIKLQSSPEKKTNFIRPPFQEKYKVQDNVINMLKAIEDMEYETILKQREKKKRILQQRSICKFVKRSKSHQSSPEKSISSQQNSKNPEYSSLHNFIENAKRKSKIMIENNRKTIQDIQKSHFQSLNGSQDLLSSKIQQKKQTLKTYESQSTNIEAKRDLIKQTNKIRQQVQSMQTLSYYQAVQLKKKRKQILNQL